MKAPIILPIGTLARILDGNLLAIEISYQQDHIDAARVGMCRLRQAIAGDRYLNIVGPFSALDQHLEDAYQIDAE